MYTSKLWTPMIGMVNDFRLSAWNDNRSLYFHGFDRWDLPLENTWMEDPFHNKTWSLWYQCLTWLYLPSLNFEKTGDRKYLEQIRNYSLSWMKEHQDIDLPSKNTMSWDDHAVAYRSTLLIYIYLKYFQSDKDWGDHFNKSITMHAQCLHEFLSEPRFYGNNHGVFHCFALLNIYSAIRYLDFPHFYKIDAERRLAELLHEMIDWDEGVTREQAIEYQYIGMELVDEVINFVDKFSLTNSELISGLKLLILKMIDFSINIRWPDNTLPAIGDTWLNWSGWSVSTLDILIKYSERYPINQDSLKKLIGFRDSTSIKFPSVYAYPVSGVVMIDGGSEKWSLLLKGGPIVHSHGHNDHLNVQYFQGDSLILVDSGGPYKYSDPLREYFKSTRAHNILCLKGQDYFPYGILSEDLSFVMTDSYAHIGGVHRLSEHVFHVRNTIYILKSKLLLVFDEVYSESAINVDVETYWHFSFDLNVSELTKNYADGVFVVANEKFHSNARIISNSYFSCEVVKGQTDPDMQGWVTTKVGEMIPAPVVTINANVSSNDFFVCLLIEDQLAVGDASSVNRKYNSRYSDFVVNSGDCWNFIFDKHKLISALKG
jgi:hypothetical protein